MQLQKGRLVNSSSIPRRILRLRSAVVLLVAASLLAATGLQNATAAPPPAPPDVQSQLDAAAALGVSMSADGWITYTQPHAAALSLTKVKSVTTVGKRNADGSCAVGLDVNSASGVGDYAEEVALNPQTCQAKFITGQLPADVAAKLNTAAQSPVGASSGASSASTQGAIAATTSYQSAYTIARWIDPVNIVITSQAVDLKWPLYGAGGTLTAAWPYYKFPYDGWTVYGPSTSGFVTLSGNTGWSFQASSHFVNTDFATIVYVLLGLSGWLACDAHATNRADFYHTVKTIGYRSGSRGSSWSNSVSGACSNLVHIEAWGAYGWW